MQVRSANAIDYIPVGDYFIPALTLPQPSKPIGKWERIYRDFLKGHHPIRYNTLILTGQLWELLATMTAEQKELFSRYSDCVREFHSLAECLLFQNSFRLGARIMVVVMEK